MSDKKKLAQTEGLKTKVSAFEAARIAAMMMIQNENSTLSRDALQSLLGINKCRDIDKECGYPKGYISAQVYKESFEKISAGNRVVKVRPDQCWSEYPDLFETEEETETPFEKRWNELLTRLRIWTQMHNLDVVSGIGRYGVMLFGFNDGYPLDKPVRGFNDRLGRLVGRPPANLDVNFLRCFDETLVDIEAYDTDERSPRFGLPTSYQLTFVDTNNTRGEDDDAARDITDRKIVSGVHWSRILHFADNTISSPIFGLPRQAPVFTDLLDYKKVKGGASEGMWSGGFPGISLESTSPDVEFDAATIDSAMQKYFNRQSRSIALENLRANTLAPNIASPDKHVAMILESICCGIDVPVRVFAGAQSGQLASELESQAWNRILSGRQKRLLIPDMIRPFANRLIQLGVLPRPKNLFINWTDFETITETQRSEISMKRTQALLQYCTSGAEKIMPLEIYLSKILYFNDKEVKEIVKKAKSQKTYLTKDLWDKKAGLTPATSGTSPQKKTGTAGNKNAQGKPKPKK